MSGETEEQANGSDGIELQPLDNLPPPSRFVEQSAAPTGGLDGDASHPVPAHPLHLCVECEYILTGLTARRCPECGTPFTLLEARRQGRSLLPEFRRDRRAIRLANAGLYVGSALQALAVIVPMVMHWRAGSLLNLWLVIIAVLVGVGVCMYKLTWDRTWPEAMLLGGVVAALVSFVLWF